MSERTTKELSCKDVKKSETINQVNPKNGWITLNRDCNMRCKWCYAKETEYRGELSLEFAKKLATLILDSGVKKITLIGGEPTLWSHLFEFNKFCRNLGIKTLIVTNALRFSDDTFWERYKENPNDLAGISLKGHSKSSYKEIAGINDFDSVISGLKRGLDFFQCGVHTVYSSPDPEGLVDTAKFAKEIGARHLKIGFCKPTITKKGPDGSFMLPPSQVVNNVLNVYDEVSSIMEDRISFSMNLPLCLWPEEFLELLSSKKQMITLCQLRHKSGLIFGTSGEIIACNSLFDYPLGEFGKDFSTGEELLSFLNSTSVGNSFNRLNNYPSEKCVSCKKHSLCGGGCVMLWSVYKADEIIKGF